MEHGFGHGIKEMIKALLWKFNMGNMEKIE